MKYLIVATALLALSCGKDQPQPAPPPPAPPVLKKMSIPDSAFLLIPGTSAQLKAFFPADADSSAGVNWTSTDTSVAVVNAFGTVQAKKKGQAYIIAKDIRSLAVSDSASLYVLGNKPMHLVGTASNSSWRDIAYYWYNDKASPLPGVQMQVGAQASAVTVHQGNVYISGTTLSPYFWSIATVWKNGTPTLVSDPGVSYNMWVNDILVNDDGIHMVGFDYRDYGCNPNCYSGTKGHYWKINGTQASEIPIYGINDSISTTLNAITKDGNDIILGGQTVPYHYWGSATIWKNTYAGMDSFTHLSYASVSDLVSTGSGVIAGGSDGCPWTNCIQSATIWDRRNGTTIRLTDGSRGSAVNALAWDGSRIIAVGHEWNSVGNREAACWVVENGKVSRISLGNTAAPSMANAVVVKDGEYFIAGYSTHDATNNRIATLWRVYQGLSIMLPQYSTSPWNGHSTFYGLFIE